MGVKGKEWGEEDPPVRTFVIKGGGGGVEVKGMKEWGEEVPPVIQFPGEYLNYQDNVSLRIK